MKLQKAITFSFSLGFCLICWLLCWQAAWAQPKNWQKKIAAQFTIFFDPTDEKNADQILEAAIAALPEISNELNITFLDSVTIILTPSEKSYSQLVGKNFPDWSEGVASPAQNLIILKSPRFSHGLRDNDKIAVHELTHILLNQATGGKPLPRWLNEGLAVYYSGEKELASNSLISKALITDSIVPLEEIDHVLNFYQDKAQLAYQESYLAVNYLFEKFDSQAIQILLAQFAQGKNIDAALLEAVGMDQTDFEFEWLQMIQKKYRWHFLLDFDIYLWILMLILFLFGYLIIRRRNRLTMQRWDEEEKSEEAW